MPVVAYGSSSWQFVTASQAASPSPAGPATTFLIVAGCYSPIPHTCLLAYLIHCRLAAFPLHYDPSIVGLRNLIVGCNTAVPAWLKGVLPDSRVVVRWLDPSGITKLQHASDYPYLKTHRLRSGWPLKKPAHYQPAHCYCLDGLAGGLHPVLRCYRSPYG